HETAKIDTLIAKQQQLIELLKEKRQAMISHAVTKGLNPAAPMKDSGIEWLGEVPEHWDVTRLKYEIDLNPRVATVEFLPSMTCNFVPMEKLKTDSILLDETRTIGEVFTGYTCFCNGDVLMAKVTPCFENRNIAVAADLKNGIGFGSTEIYVLRPKTNIDKNFLFYRLQENQFMNIATAAMTGAGGLKRVPAEIINNFKLALPPYNEQLAICEFLEEQKGKFGALETFSKKQIDLHKERRTSLISAAVTGKIDVRGWQTINKINFSENKAVS
ncbi:MAG: restriction endonuclease subunit S, partial [Shewanella sp.]